MNLLITNSKCLVIPGVNQIKDEVDSIVFLNDTLFKSLLELKKLGKIKYNRVYIANDNPYLLCLITFYVYVFKSRKVTLFFQELYDVYIKIFFLIKFTLKLADEVIIPSYNRKIATKLIYGYNGLFIVMLNKRHSGNSKDSSIEKNKSNYVYTGVLFPQRDILKGIQTIDEAVDVYGAGNSDYIKRLRLNKKVNYKGGFIQSNEIAIVSKYNTGVLYYPMNSINNTLCSPNKFFTYDDLKLTIHCESPNIFKSLITYNKIKRPLC